jgi:hypothetical protein
MSFGHLTNNLLHPIFCLHFYVNPIKLKLINVSKFFFFFEGGQGGAVIEPPPDYFLRGGRMDLHALLEMEGGSGSTLI